MDHGKHSLRALQDNSNRRSQVVTNLVQSSQDNAYGGKIDVYGQKGLARHSLTNNPSSHRQSRMAGQSHVANTTVIDKVQTANINNNSIDHSLRNSGALRNLSLVNKNATSTIEAVNYPNTTKEKYGRQGAGTSLVQNLNQILTSGTAGQRKIDSQPRTQGAGANTSQYRGSSTKMS